MSLPDTARMISASVDILVQIGIINEARRLTSIARVDKKLRGGEAWFIPVWRYEEPSDDNIARWITVANQGLSE